MEDKTFVDAIQQQWVGIQGKLKTMDDCLKEADKKFVERMEEEFKKMLIKTLLKDPSFRGKVKDIIFGTYVPQHTEQ